jgi:spermidine/putrescine transport system permease protein
VADTIAAPPPARRSRVPRFLLAVPSWIWYALFFLVPVVLVIVSSFGQKIPGSAGRVSLSNPSLERYREAFGSTFFKVMKQTIYTTLIGTTLCLVIGLPLAYYLATKVSVKWRGLLLAALMIPFFTNFLIRTLAWRIVLAPRGFLSNFLIDHNLRDQPIHLLDTRFAVQLGVVYNYLPLMIFPLFVAFDRLEPALREASKDLGANRVRTFTQVTLPLAMPGIVAGLVLVFVPLSGDYITAATLGGAKGNMAGALVAAQYLEAQNPALGSAIAVVLILFILLLLGAFAIVGKLTADALRRHRRVTIAGAAA